jgi:DNA-binding response OmpR family regulator
MGRSILVADDDLVTQKILRLTLECAGYEVTAAADGEETLRALEQSVPDVVVLDVMMPKIDGFSVLRRIRDDPRTAEVPVVLLTARSGPEDLWRGWQEGVDYYLTKPFDSEELLRFMARALEPYAAAGTVKAAEAIDAADALAKLPVVPRMPERTDAISDPAVSVAPLLTPTVLVVDDDPAIQRVLRMTLELEGFAVDCASDGIEALDRIAHQRPDLVLLDVTMPGLDGFDVLRRIRDGATTADLPVILLTARSGEEDMWQGWQCGVDYYMTKPFDIEELLRSIDRLLCERHNPGAAP